MNNKEFFTYLDERKTSVLEDIQALSADGRNDEANILKAKANVYDICKAVFNAAEKQAAGHVETAFPALFDKITSPWKASLELAKEHNDDRKVLVEEAKLSAVTEICGKFAELI